jgi:large-conductance mechanosensitive channel
MAEKPRKRKNPSADQIQVLTSGSNIRFEPAKSTRQPKPPKAKRVSSATSDIRPVGNFVDFLREHAVVGLIIGFVIGGQVQTIVKQLIQSFIDPLTQLLFGTALSQRTFTLHFRERYANFSWGAMAYTLIIFIFVVITMYMSIRFLQLDKLHKKEAKEEE